MELQTPYFVIEEAVLQKYYDMLTDSLEKNWGNYLVGYSFKTNSLPWLVSFMKKQGAYAEVVSQDEYSLAKYMGFRDDEIVYNGPYKSVESFRNVLMAGGYMNLDSSMELNWLIDLAREYPDKHFYTGIRANFNLEQMCPGETTMGEMSGRFGFCYETGKLAEGIASIKALPNVTLTGLHLHSSSKSRSVKVFQSIAQMACRLKREFELELSYVDLGGGYCGGMPGRPEYPDYFPAVAEELSREFDPAQTKIIVEPGISMISKCTSFVTAVFDTRDIKGTRYVMTDGSRFNIDATMIKNSYFFRIDENKVHTAERSVMEQQVISGFTCMEVDRLFIHKDSPELMPGDKIIYENVGGYTMSLNPLFIQYFPAVYVKRGDEMIQVRKKWTPEEYVQGSVWEKE